MTQQYCTRAPGTKPGAKRKCLTHTQALALSRRYQIQQCPACSCWHFYTASSKPKAPQPKPQPEVPRTETEVQAARAHGAQVLADLRSSF